MDNFKISLNECCNGCSNLDFKEKRCVKNTCPEELTHFTNAEGFIYIFPTSWCGSKQKTQKKNQKTKKPKGKE